MTTYYFLVCDPWTSRVVRCDRQPPLTTEVNLHGFCVPKVVWEHYKAGDTLNAERDLNNEQRRRWYGAVETCRKLRATAVEIMRSSG